MGRSNEAPDRRFKRVWTFVGEPPCTAHKRCRALHNSHHATHGSQPLRLACGSLPVIRDHNTPVGDHVHRDGRQQGMEQWRKMLVVCTTQSGTPDQQPVGSQPHHTAGTANMHSYADSDKSLTERPYRLAMPSTQLVNTPMGQLDLEGTQHLLQLAT